MKTWEEIENEIIAKEPRAKPFLDVIKQYWGDGKLTESIVNAYIGAYLKGNYVAAKKLIVNQMTADELIAEDQAENSRLRLMVDADKKVSEFGNALWGTLLKVALAVAMAAVGL